MAELVILAGHPFFKYAEPVVQKLNDGTWRVRWRDFYTQKQDAEFDTEFAAKEFAATVNRPPLTVDDDCPDWAAANEFWRDLK